MDGDSQRDLGQRLVSGGPAAHVTPIQDDALDRQVPGWRVLGPQPSAKVDLRETPAARPREREMAAEPGTSVEPELAMDRGSKRPQPALRIGDPVPGNPGTPGRWKSADATGRQRERWQAIRGSGEGGGDLRHASGFGRAQEGEGDVPPGRIGPAHALGARVAPPTLDRLRELRAKLVPEGHGHEEAPRALARTGGHWAGCARMAHDAASTRGRRASTIGINWSSVVMTARSGGSSSALYRPDRSISTGMMPTAWAPPTSAWRWSPTWMADSAGTPALSSAHSKMRGCGFSKPIRAEAAMKSKCFTRSRAWSSSGRFQTQLLSVPRTRRRCWSATSVGYTSGKMCQWLVTMKSSERRRKNASGIGPIPSS